MFFCYCLYSYSSPTSRSSRGRRRWWSSRSIWPSAARYNRWISTSTSCSRTHGSSTTTSIPTWSTLGEQGDMLGVMLKSLGVLLASTWAPVSWTRGVSLGETLDVLDDGEEVL